MKIGPIHLPNWFSAPLINYIPTKWVPQGPVPIAAGLIILTGSLFWITSLFRNRVPKPEDHALNELESCYPHQLITTLKTHKINIEKLPVVQFTDLDHYPRINIKLMSEPIVRVEGSSGRIGIAFAIKFKDQSKGKLVINGTKYKHSELNGVMTFFKRYIKEDNPWVTTLSGPLNEAKEIYKEKAPTLTYSYHTENPPNYEYLKQLLSKKDPLFEIGFPEGYMF